MNVGSNSCRNTLTIRGNIKSLSSLLLLKYHFLKIAWKSLLTGVALQGETDSYGTAGSNTQLKVVTAFQSADSKVPKYLQQTA